MKKKNNFRLGSQTSILTDDRVLKVRERRIDWTISSMRFQILRDDAWKFACNLLRRRIEGLALNKVSHKRSGCDYIRQTFLK